MKKGRKSIFPLNKVVDSPVTAFWPGDDPPVVGLAINFAFQEFVRCICIAVPVSVSIFLPREGGEIPNPLNSDFYHHLSFKRNVCVAAYSASRHKREKRGEATWLQWKFVAATFDAKTAFQNLSRRFRWRSAFSALLVFLVDDQSFESFGEWWETRFVRDTPPSKYEEFAED